MKNLIMRCNAEKFTRFTTFARSNNSLTCPSMSSLKQALKDSKQAIEVNDPEDALYYADRALELEENNYFAYIFKGKSYQLLKKFEEAVAAFKKATSIEPENLLGWKGFFQVVKSGNDFDLFFTVWEKFLEIQILQNVGIAETLRDTRNYLEYYDYKRDLNLYEKYLRTISPGTQLGDLLGNSLGSPEDNLKALINVVKQKESDEITRTISKEKLKLSRVITMEQKNNLNKISWSIHKKYNLSLLYEKFLDICNSDELREKCKEEYLSYKYKLLEVSPGKSTLICEIKDMLEGIVLIRMKTSFCWSLYFDLIDIGNVGELDRNEVLFYLKTFPKDGLSMVLYAYLMSDISPFDPSEVQREIKNDEPKKGERDEDNLENLKEASLLEDTRDGGEADSGGQKPRVNHLSMMLEGFAKSSNSVLANRIICQYYIYLREYAIASEKCRDAVKLLATMQRNLGIDLVRSKEDLLCSLAIVYTHYEVPKNYPRALQLYDRILESNGSNTRAAVGKSLILVAKNDLYLADKLLSKALNAHPEHVQIIVEYNWCQIKMGHFVEGRNELFRALDMIKDMDQNSRNSRANIYWKIAKSFLIENLQSSTVVDNAYSNLLQSLKNSANYAPSFTLLGILYKDFYGDDARAHKCFYKAFELDISEILAAKYLIKDFASKNVWDICEVLCTRIVRSEHSHRLLISPINDDPDKSWPYRVLGCSALNRQDDAKAVEWFQAALRMTSMDLPSWLGLGEAYFNCGRYEACLKVFNYALSLDEDFWFIKYMIGLVNCHMFEFESGMEYLHKALKSKPGEECILTALYEANVEWANKLIEGAFFGRTLDTIESAIMYIAEAVKTNPFSQNIWKSLGEVLKVYLTIEDNKDKIPFDVLYEIFDQVKRLDKTADNRLTVSDVPICDIRGLVGDGALVEALWEAVILSQKLGILILPAKSIKAQRSIAYYNLAVALFENYARFNSTSRRELAIKYLHKALKLENRNISFWIALGNAYVSVNPLVAQHCFIKATSLQNNNPETWINLAALYLRYGDVELAHQAFLRAQSIAPQKSEPWLGQALVAEAKVENAEASNLYTHAFVISNGKSQLAQLLYGLAVVNKRIEISNSDPRDIDTAQEFSVANFAITNFLKFSPTDEAGLKVALILSERCQNYSVGVDIGVRLCSILEARFEKTESIVALTEFAKTKTQISRLYLGLEDYASALENAQTALDIVDESSSYSRSDTARSDTAPIYLSSQVVIALSFFLCGQFSEAVEQLQSVLANYSEYPRVITLAAQILNAYGTAETKQAALDQLFAFIEERGPSLLILLTLGALSLAENLLDYLPAIRDEFNGLSLAEIAADSRKLVPQMLSEISSRLNPACSPKIWQRNAVLFPLDYSIWKRINSRMALTIASLPLTKVSAYEMSKAYIKVGDLRHIQRALVLYPCNEISSLLIKQILQHK